MQGTQMESEARQREPQLTAFTIQEVAERLGCHPKTVRREMQRGRLAYIRVGVDPRIPHSSLAAYLKVKEKSAPAHKRGAR